MKYKLIMIYEIKITIDILLSKRLAIKISYFLTRCKAKAVPTMMMNTKNNVIPCNVSTKVKDDVSGKAESMTYLFPIIANKDPTLKPNRDSTLSA